MAGNPDNQIVEKGKGVAFRRLYWFWSHSEMALEGHSSMQAPQSMHLSASMTAMSSQVMALSGQTSTHAPHATHSEAFTVTIMITSERKTPEGL